MVRTGGGHEINAGGTEREVGYGIGDVTTVWDGEVAGMAGGLAEVRTERKVIKLADSKAAIAAVRRAGRVGKVKSRHPQEVVNTKRRGRRNKGEVGESTHGNSQ